MSSFPSPNVATPDVATPQTLQGAGLIAGNLNAQADRLAAAARQRAALDAETKLRGEQIKSEEKRAKMELDATAQQHAIYQDFQAKQQQTQIAAQQQAQQKQQDFEGQQQQNAYAQQDKIQKHLDVIKLAENDLAAKKLSAAADVADQYTGKLKALSDQRKDAENAFAATQVQLATAEGKEGAFRDFATEQAQHLNAARMQAGTLGVDATKEAIQRAIGDTLDDQKSGVQGFVQTVESQIASGANPQGAVLGELVSRLGKNVANYFGGEVAPQHTALTDSAALGDKLVERLAPKLAAVAQNGATISDVKAQLSKFITTGLIAHQTYNEKGSLVGADSQKAMADFTQEAKKLGDLVSPQAVQGMVEMLKQSQSIYDSAIGERDKVRGKPEDLTKGEKTARKKTFDAMAGVGDVYEVARRQEGSGLPTLDYHDKVDAFIPKMMDAYAQTSLGVDDFIHSMKSIGLSPADITNITSRFEKDKTKLPDALKVRLEEMRRRVGGIDQDIELGGRQAEVESLRRGASLSQQQVMELQRTLLQKGNGN